MQRQPVTSSNIASVGYDPADQMLEVEFKNGQVYQYYRVLPMVYQGLMSAESKGGYFHSHIRDVYEYRRLGQSHRERPGGRL